MFLRPGFTYDESKYFFGFSFISIIKNSSISLKYLLGLLNSKYGFYWFIKNAKIRGVGFDVTNDLVRNFPIPKINEQNNKFVIKIISIVEKLLLSKNNEQTLLDQIDKLIFNVCKLNDKQISNIDSTISNFLHSHGKI